MKGRDMKQGFWLSAVLLTALTAHAASPSATLAGAQQVAAFGPAGWLAQDKKQLRLLTADGRESARLKVRSESLDVRADGRDQLAVVIDQDAQRVLPLRVDPFAGTLTALPLLPTERVAAEAVCLYRDPQGLLQVFVIGDDGAGEQWLLSGTTPRKLRDLALPPGVETCQVDDDSGQLLVAEAGFGLWAYPADPELPLTRRPVLLQKPYGPLKGNVGAIARQASSIVLAGEQAGQLYRLQADERGRWRSTLLKSAGRIKALGRDPLGSGLIQLDAQPWADLALSPPPPVLRTLTPIVLPRQQTAPVAQLGDAADDPAIWVHATDPAQSRVLGTNKKQGLLVYDLNGAERQFLPVGRINNVDVRQRVLLGNTQRDLAVASQRDEQAIVVFDIRADGMVSELGRVPTGLDDVYGICAYRNAGGAMEVFINDKDGRFAQIRLIEQGGKLAGQQVRGFRVATQPEGCVADEQSGTLFFGEEKRGLWALPADAASQVAPRLLVPVGTTLRPDVEGMGVYHGSKRSYLVVSSQGANRYEVFETLPPHRHRGSFRIGINVAAGIDAVSETDGLEVISAALGPDYPQGMLVVQDGHKRLPAGPQNFKYVDWREIARTLRLD